MKREDWPERLIETVGRHSRLPFSWGVSDCLTLPADCILAMTGTDPFAAIRRRYTTELGAARVMRREGWASVADIFALHLEEIPPAMAGRGDIGVVDDPKGLAGVVFLDGNVIGKSETGIRRLPRSRALRAWRVA